MLPLAVLTLTLAQAPVLTLEAAVDTARKQNLDLEVARARLLQSREISKKVWAAYLPTINVGASYTYNNLEARLKLPTRYEIRDVVQPQGNPFDPSRELGPDNPPGLPTSYIQFPTAFSEAPIQVHNQLGAQLQVNQALVAPALWPAIQNAYVAEKVAELNVENSRRELLFGVAQLYYGAASLKEVAEVQERLLEGQRAHEKDAQVRFDAGAAPRLLLLRAQIDRAKTEQDVVRSRNAYASSKIALATLLNRDAQFEVARPEGLLVRAERIPSSDEAQELRPDVRAAKASLDLAEGQSRGTLFKYLPTLGASGTWRWTNVTGFVGRQDSWFVSVGLNWQLWDGGLRESERRENEARVLEARASLQSLENKARDELARALLDLESAQANRVKAEEQLRLARESAQVVQVNFKAGAATYLEVTDSNTALRQAELGAIAEVLNAELAELKVAKAAGLFGAETR
jgi:multidrug efflux system outer membrane protein